MAKIYIGTTFVTDDEPCLNLKEVNQRTPDSKGIHRYQVITVIRQDRPVEYRLDLGPAKKFKAHEFNIPGGAVNETTGKIYVEETIGRLRDLADHLRSEPPRISQGHNLLTGYANHLEKN